MKLHTWVTGIVLLQIVGCAATTTKCAPPVIANETSTELIVFWPLDRGADYDFIRIAIGGCTIGELPKNKYLTYRVAAGVHRVQALDYGDGRGGGGEITTDLRAGQALYLRYRKTYGLPTRGVFAVSDRSAALKLMPALADTVR
jgi:hypothetical protein